MGMPHDDDLVLLAWPLHPPHLMLTQVNHTTTFPDVHMDKMDSMSAFSGRLQELHTRPEPVVRMSCVGLEEEEEDKSGDGHAAQVASGRMSLCGDVESCTFPAAHVTNCDDERKAGPMVSAVARHCSYEEVVCQQQQQQQPAHPDDEASFDDGLEKLTQWALMLQQSVPQDKPDKCLCHRAALVGSQLRALAGRMCSEPSRSSRSASLAAALKSMQETLRSHVSIQISSADEQVRAQARQLLLTHLTHHAQAQVPDVMQFLNQMVRNLALLVDQCLYVPHCRHSTSHHCPDQHPDDLEESLRLGVQRLSTHSSSLASHDQPDPEDEQLAARNRKRKQVFPKCMPKPTFYCTSPNKRPRRPGFWPHSGSMAAGAGSPERVALSLLENKTKSMHTSGLYQWVLWREALKGEKDRVMTSPSPLLLPD